MAVPIITLTTDFGTRDGYVGALKGMLFVNGPCTIVDLAHEVPRGDIAHAAWLVNTATQWFPRDTIHVVVVDPGVGSARRGLVAFDGEHYFVGPDNGVFTYVENLTAWSIESAEWMHPLVSPTFHGRDVFAPVAAMLGAELAMFARVRPERLDALGPRVDALVQLPWGERTPGEGRVVHLDHYGNLVSDLPPEEMVGLDGVAIAGTRVPMHRTYTDVAAGALLAYVGSAGTIEIAVRDGRADRALAAPRGTVVIPIGPGGPYR